MTMPPDVRAEAKGILDRAARRLLEEQQLSEQKTELAQNSETRVSGQLRPTESEDR
jgi:hypothetical protein